jgi:AsmA protein
VNAAGKSVNALKRALAGTAKLDLRDGAIKGIDIAALARKVQSLSGGGAQAAASAEKRTALRTTTISTTSHRCSGSPGTATSTSAARRSTM